MHISVLASLKDMLGMTTAILDAVSCIFVFNRLDDKETSSASGGQIQLQMKAFEELINAILMYFDAPVQETDVINQNIDIMHDKVNKYTILRLPAKISPLYLDNKDITIQILFSD